MGMEEHGIVLDYLPQGHPEDERPTYKREPLVLAVGKKYFSLLELIPRKGAEFSVHEDIYVGKGEREKIEYVKRRIDYDDLSAAAKSELPYVIEELIDEDKGRFVNFFNESQAISTRLHKIELLPGIGKKLMWEILEERRKKPFESFEDISKRVKAISDPEKLLVKRILLELEGGTKLGKGKYKLFTAPPRHVERG